MLSKIPTPEEFIGIAILRECGGKPQVLLVKRRDDHMFRLPGGLVWRDDPSLETAAMIVERTGVKPVELEPILFVSGFDARLLSSENRELFDFEETHPVRNATFYATLSFTGTPRSVGKGEFDPPAWVTIEPSLFTKKHVVLVHHEGLKQACRWAMQKSEAFYYFGIRNQRVLDPVL